MAQGIIGSVHQSYRKMTKVNPFLNELDAVVSRGLVGVSGSTLVANVAGSRQAIRDGLATLIPLAAHVIGAAAEERVERDRGADTPGATHHHQFHGSNPRVENAYMSNHFVIGRRRGRFAHRGARPKEEM